MLLLLTTIAGLVIWVVLWAIGVKSFDAFLITIVMVVLAATWQLVSPNLPGDRGLATTSIAYRTVPREPYFRCPVRLGYCTPEPGVRRIAARTRAS